jgi:hypothetical protein
MNQSLATATGSATNVRSPWHSNTDTLAAALERMARDLRAAGPRPIATVHLQVTLVTESLAPCPTAERQATVDYLGNVLLDGQHGVSSASSGLYRLPNSSGRGDMDLTVYSITSPVAVAR